jgi:ribosomal-protein-alanine acetyltransferase
LPEKSESGLKQRAKRLILGLLGKDPEAVVVSFLSGNDERATAMVKEVRGLIPDRRHYAVGLGFIPEIEGITGIPVHFTSFLGIYRELRASFRHLRIGMAAVLFDNESAYRPLRQAAFLLAPGKILAYNSHGERHHLRLRTAIASMLFLGGMPLDRIYLRPWWLCPWKRDRTVIPNEYLTIDGRPLSAERPRVAVISPYFPYPLSHGGAVRIFNLLRESAREFDLFLFAFIEDGAPEDHAPVLEFCSKVILVKKPRYREPRWSSLKPPEVGEYRSPVMYRLIREYCREYEIRLLEVEYTQLAEYGLETRPDVLVEHDVTFDLYAQVHARERTLSSWWNLYRWRRFETRAVRRFRRVVVMSDKDAEMLPAVHASVIANGVDLERFQPSPEREGWRLLFIGSFRHFPNVVAFRFLADQVWPLVSEQFPEMSLTVVAGPDALLHWRNYSGLISFPPLKRTRVLQFVADVRPLYEESNLALVPTLVSAGTNVKVLEAMAMERAVVSTSSGCQGLQLEHGASVWIADDAASFAQGIAILMTDPQLRARIAGEARRIAQRQFDWRNLGGEQRQFWHESLGTRPKEPQGAPLIRPATEEDLARIAQIQAGSPEAAQWLPAYYLAYDCRVATVNGTVTAFLVLRRTADGEHEILNLAVAPEFRRRGIARALLRNATQSQGGRLFLEVRESNEPARNLYREVGFSETGVRRRYYSDPEESAIVMRF